MPEGPKPLDYEAICKYVGRLYLESQREIERLVSLQANPVIESLHQSLAEAERRISELQEEVRSLKEEQV